MMRLKHEAQGYEKMRKLPEGVLSMKPVRPNDFSEWHASINQFHDSDVMTVHVPDNYPFTGPETVFKVSPPAKAFLAAVIDRCNVCSGVYHPLCARHVQPL